MQALMKSLNELCDALPFQTSFYVKDLITGARGDRFGSVAVPSASTRKISILMAALLLYLRQRMLWTQIGGDA